MEVLPMMLLWDNNYYSQKDGWKRYDDTDKNIIYDSSAVVTNNERSQYMGGNTCAKKIQIYAKTKKIKLGADLEPGGYLCENIAVDVDGILYRVSQKTSGVVYQGIFFDKEDLEEKIHCITIYVDEKTTTSTVYNNNKFIDLDYIDKDGALLPCSESIAIDKSTMNLTAGDSGQLTATTIPAAVGVTWASSDPSIATIEVDPTTCKIVKVNALKEGTYTITATTTDGSNL